MACRWVLAAHAFSGFVQRSKEMIVVFCMENFCEIRGMKAAEYIILFGAMHIHLIEIKCNLYSQKEKAESGALCKFGLSTASFA